MIIETKQNMIQIILMITLLIIVMKRREGEIKPKKGTVQGFTT